MSASHKKKLRKEQNAADLTEKQLAQQKEDKNLRLYTTLFVAALVLVLSVVVVSGVVNSGIIERSTTAVTVDNSKISAVELNYYYIDTINNYLSQWGDYVSLTGLDTTTALDEQVYDAETGDTWADYFLDQATLNIQSAYSLYNKAVAEGYTLTEAAQTEIDSTLATMQLYAYYYGFSDVQSYLVGMYGNGSNEDTYRDYCQVQYIASQYASDHNDSLVYTADDVAAALAENPKAQNTYSYNYYYLATTSFLAGGTADDEGNITYSDEEKAAAEADCLAAAQELSSGTYAGVEVFDKAIRGLAINSGNESAASTAASNRQYSSVSSTLRDWITDDARQAGDVGMIPYESTTTDADGNETTVVNGCYVVYFTGMDENTYMMDNVRHILVSFAGGTEDEDGNTVYSDEEKAAALAEAEEILNTYLAGELTEDAFSALAVEKSDDTGSASTGGLISDIIPTSNYVENFLNWAIDDARTPGETGIVETEYGYHVMYYVSQSEWSYRDTAIINSLRSADMTAWETEIREAAVLTVKNTGKVATDLTLSSES